MTSRIDFFVGQRVLVNGAHCGTVKYMGPTAGGRNGNWIGVELDEPYGRHDGKPYFTCKPLHGVLCRPSAVKPLGTDPGAAASASVTKSAASEKKQQIQPSALPAKKQKQMTPEQIFEVYAAAAAAEEGEGTTTPGDTIGAAGIAKLLEDMRTTPESVTALLLAWKLGMSGMSLTKVDFVGAMNRLGCRTVGDLKARIDRIQKEVSANHELFKELFVFAFNFSKEAPEQKVVDVKTSAEMLALVFQASPVRGSSIIQEFVRFLNSGPQQRVINKDQWTCILDFVRTVPSDLLGYDSSSSACE